MKILGIDIETGAKFDTPKEENFITEIGAVLWDTDLGCPGKLDRKLEQENKVLSLRPRERHQTPRSFVVLCLCNRSPPDEFVFLR